MEETTAHDLSRLFDAIRTVRRAAVVESAAVGELLAAPSEVAAKAVHAAHLVELDAVQAMGAAMELLARRHPAFMESLAAVATRTRGIVPARQDNTHALK